MVIVRLLDDDYRAFVDKYSNVRNDFEARMTEACKVSMHSGYICIRFHEAPILQYFTFSFLQYRQFKYRQYDVYGKSLMGSIWSLKWRVPDQKVDQRRLGERL